MEDIPPIGGPHRESLRLPIHRWLMDHRFMGQAVLPGVLALEHLARTVGRAFPGVDLSAAGDIRFEKLLTLPSSEGVHLAALAELAGSPAEGIEAVLVTRHVAAQSGMTRMKAHVRVGFGAPFDASDPLPQAPSWQENASKTFDLPVDRLYQEMVPFGNAFQNVIAPVRLWPEGARTVVSGGRVPADDAPLRLGSPFPLDAAFHAACAWAQRYTGRVAFPVALQQRVILQPTVVARAYDARVRFREKAGDRLRFDLWLHDREGALCEFVRGLVMGDISGGKLKPPAWVRA
ncbi:MAG: polyketide synthase dehydratase domain-containing protein [Desulfobacterales bacterium]